MCVVVVVVVCSRNNNNTNLPVLRMASSRFVAHWKFDSMAKRIDERRRVPLPIKSNDLRRQISIHEEMKRSDELALIRLETNNRTKKNNSSFHEMVPQRVSLRYETMVFFFFVFSEFGRTLFARHNVVYCMQHKMIGFLFDSFRGDHRLDAAYDIRHTL